MQFGHKVISSQQKFGNDIVHFKLTISNIIKNQELNDQPRFFLNTHSAI